MAQYPLMMKLSVCVLIAAVVSIQLLSVNVELTKSESPEQLDGSERSEPLDSPIESSTTTSAPSDGERSAVAEQDESPSPNTTPSPPAAQHEDGEPKPDGDSRAALARNELGRLMDPNYLRPKQKQKLSEKLSCDKFGDPSVVRDCCRADLDVVVGNEEPGSSCIELVPVLQQCCDSKGGKKSALVKQRMNLIVRITSCFAKIITNIAQGVPKLPEICCSLTLMRWLPSCQNVKPPTSKMPSTTRPKPTKPSTGKPTKPSTGKPDGGDDGDDDLDGDGKSRSSLNSQNIKDKVFHKAEEAAETGDD